MKTFIEFFPMHIAFIEIRQRILVQAASSNKTLFSIYRNPLEVAHWNTNIHAYTIEEVLFRVTVQVSGERRLRFTLVDTMTYTNSQVTSELVPYEEDVIRKYVFGRLHRNLMNATCQF